MCKDINAFYAEGQMHWERDNRKISEVSLKLRQNIKDKSFVRNLSNSLCCFVRCLTTTNKTIKQYNIVTTQSNMSRSDLPKNKLQLVSKTHFVFQLTINLVPEKSQKNFLRIHCIGWCLSRKCIQNLFNPVHYLVILKNTFVSVSPSCEFCESHKQ